MTTRQSLRPCALLLILAALTASATACSKPEPATARAAPPATGGVAQTDDDLTAYITWYRDWKLVINRQRAELDAVTQTVAARYSFAETGNIVQDPEFLALLARQREEMRPLMARVPSGAHRHGIRGDARRYRAPAPHSQRHDLRAGPQRVGAGGCAQEVRRQIRGLGAGAREQDRRDAESVVGG
jgi:hypothetical protein